VFFKDTAPTAIYTRKIVGIVSFVYLPEVEQKKADAKKKAKKAAEEKQAEKRAEKAESEKDLVTVTASSVEELLRKVDDTVYDALSDSVQTDSERLVGQNFSFRC
ncbi:MAG: hypothetical protein K2I01_04260, partial [Lachnospiraceae bacterium]|nr:hypothetical protein [Lachnospiraceae bacterium]